MASGWKLLGAISDFRRPLPEIEPHPYGALVVAKDFGAFSMDDLSRLGLWLLMTGCTYGSFHGTGSERAEDIFDGTVVMVTMAIDGDAEYQRLISEDWTGSLQDCGVARWRRDVYLSVSHDPEIESIAALVEEFHTWNADTFEHGLAIPLDEKSAVALREVFREAGIEPSP